MPYTKQTWTDESPSEPLRYSINGDVEGEISASAAIDVVSTVVAGSPVNAERLNYMEDGIETAQADVDALTAALQPKVVVGNQYIYTADDTWTKPANLAFVEVEVIGGGGGGGGAQATGAGEAAAGGGGGGGGYSYEKILAASLGATEAITRGAGGAGGVGGALGAAGGTSSFGTHLQATGGNGGFYGIAAASTDAMVGGGGGIGSGGNINLYGDDGGYGIFAVGPLPLSGFGGASKWGSIRAGKNANNNGNDGRVYGSGGSGGACEGAGQGPQNGGAGAAGIVIVREYLTMEDL